MGLRSWIGFGLMALLFSQSVIAGSFKENVAIEKMLANISPPDASVGAIIASPSKDLPNYYFHWTRDSALVLNALVQLYARKSAVDSAFTQRLEKTIDDVIAFGRKTQSVPTASGSIQDFFKNFGEPRFMLDGSGDSGEWCRPQTDGPGLRAIATLAYVRILQSQGKHDKVRALYRPQASESFLKADLEYVAHHWRDTGCDLWEETYGHFFYNRVVHRRALLEGAQLANQLGDGGAAAYYLEQVPAIEAEIEKHWDGQLGYLVTTLDWAGGNSSKKMNLDASVVLASNHTASDQDSFYSATNDRIQATAYRIAKQYQTQYPINQVSISSAGEVMAPGIGRYPEDIYDGASLTGGNAWFLLNHGFAELYFRAVREYHALGKIRITELNREFMDETLAASRCESHKPLRAGDEIHATDPRFAGLMLGLGAMARAHLARAEHHTAQDGSISEQFNRFNGVMQGARDLTWSYASALTARWAASAP